VKSHGFLKFSWKSNVLYVQVLGPFNEEGVIEESSKYLSAISNRKVADFSVIELWDEEALGSPKAMNDVCKLWKKLITQNCISLAIVVPNSVQRDIAEKLLPSIGKVFGKIEDAEYWVLDRNCT